MDIISITPRKTKPHNPLSVLARYYVSVNLLTYPARRPTALVSRNKLIKIPHIKNMEDEIINYKGYNIEIKQDKIAESPDDWGDDVLFLVGWDSRNFWIEREEFTKEIFGAYIDPDNYEDYIDEMKTIKKEYHIFGLDAYIHSGISLSLHNEGYCCRWDTSNFIGAVFVKKTEVKTKPKAEKIARGLIETWNDYLSGNIYGYNIELDDGNDSCCGYYGNPDKSGLLDEAKSIINYHIKQKNKKHLAKTRAFIKNKVPLSSRIF